MRHARHAIAFVVAVLFSSPVAAEVYGWGGEVELGLVGTRGNSDTTTMKFKTRAVRESEAWVNEVTVEAFNTSTRGITTGERYLLEGTAKYRLPKKRYAFANGKYEHDRFGGYEYRGSVAFGYGGRVRETRTYRLDLEAGPGARRSQLENDDFDDEVIFRLFGDFAWTVNEYTTLSEKLTVEGSTDVTLTKSETALKSRIAEKLALKAAYLIRHASTAPENAANTDRELTFTVVYDFK